MKKTAESLNEALAKDNELVNAVIFVGDPDPDALGSGLGMAYYIKSVLGGNAEVVYSGEITRKQNKILVKILDLQVKSEEEFLDQLNSSGEGLDKSYNAVVTTDMTPFRLSEPFADADVSVVLDHHGVDYRREGCYVDERKVGSTCTIVWDYFKQAGLELSEEKEDQTALATILLYGIRTDTNLLVSEDTSDDDRDAYVELSKIVDKKKVKDIENYTLPSYFFQLQGDMASDPDNTCVEGACFVGCVGPVQEEQADVFSVLAEERLRQEGIVTSIVFGFVDGDITGSLRTKDTSLMPKKFLPAIFGGGGGRGDIGGFRIPSGPASPKDLPEELLTKVWKTHRDAMMFKIREQIKRS